MAQPAQPTMPDYLLDQTRFLQKLDNDFEALGAEKGDRFAEFALYAFDLFHSSRPMGRPVGKTGDGGVDLEWTNEGGEIIAIGQAKYKIREVIDIDSILSKIKNKLVPPAIPQAPSPKNKGKKKSPTPEPAAPKASQSLFKEEPPIDGERLPVVRIITVSMIDALLKKYAEKNLGARDFYDALVQSKKLEIVDLEDLYTYYKAIFKKHCGIPESLTLALTQDPVIHDGKIYIGIIPVLRIKELHREHADGLFYDNVREFRGLDTGDEPVNREILETLNSAPEAFLGRNNGLTFKAESAEYDNKTKKLLLHNGALINGCQTTCCISEARGDLTSAFVSFKVVSSIDPTNAWEVSKTANNQNQIRKIDLEIAEFMRPQLVRSMLAADSEGITIKVAGDAPAAKLMKTIASSTIEYEDIRSLFIGLFMNNPRQMLNVPVNRIGKGLDLLREKYRGFEQRKDLINLLARIVREAGTALETFVKAAPSDELATYKRFFEETNTYRPFLAVVAIFFALGITSEDDFEAQKSSLPEFLQKLKDLLDKTPQVYREAVREAIVAVISHVDSVYAEDRGQISTQLFGLLKSTPIDKYCRAHALKHRLDVARQAEQRHDKK